jgi:flagellar motor component MotA
LPGKAVPEVFPECRADHQGQWLSWINALVEGLRRYGQHSLHGVCSNLQAEGDAFVRDGIRVLVQKLQDIGLVAS